MKDDDVGFWWKVGMLGALFLSGCVGAFFGNLIWHSISGR